MIGTRRQGSRTAVCIVRVEVEPRSVLITVRQNPDIADSAREKVAVFTEIDAVLATVRVFLEEGMHSTGTL
jgi:hypothetical protein